MRLHRILFTALYCKRQDSQEQRVVQAGIRFRLMYHKQNCKLQTANSEQVLLYTIPILQLICFIRSPSDDARPDHARGRVRVLRQKPDALRALHPQNAGLCRQAGG
jgi:hypothetical protein